MSKEMKHSAYRSMQLGKEGKIKNKDGNLDIWIRERWRNLTPLTLADKDFYECGKKSKEQIKKNIPSVCRPSRKINENTPTLAKEYDLKKIKRAIEIKKKGKRIDWSML